MGQATVTDEGNRPFVRHHNVAALESWIGVDVYCRQAVGVFAIAGAVGDDALTIDESVLQARVFTPIPSDRVVDTGAGKDLRLAGRALRGADFRRRKVRGVPLDRKVPSVAQTHAIGHRRPCRPGRFILGYSRSENIAPRIRVGHRWTSSHWRPALEAEKAAKYIAGSYRADIEG